jgi:signal transduction histidine kinase
VQRKFAIERLRRLPAVLVGVLSALVLAIIWGSIAATLIADRDRAFAEARQDLRNNHQMFTTKVLGEIGAALGRAAGVEAWLALASRTPLAPPLGDIVHVLKTMEATVLQPQDIRLIGAGGEAISLTGVLNPYIDVSDREWFRGAMALQPGQFHTGQTIIARDTGTEVVPIAVRAHENAYGIAVVVASMDIGLLRDAIGGVLEAGQSTGGIIRTDGTVLFDSRQGPGYAGGRIPNFLFKDTAKNDKSTTIFEHRSSSTGLPRLSAATAFERIPIVVYTSLLVDEVDQQWWRQVQNTLALGGVATLIVLTLSIWIFVLLRRNERDAVRISQALAQSAALSRAKSDFMGRMSHELRTPLNAILGFSEMMIDPRFASAAVRRGDYARDIHHSGKHLLAMIDQILEVSKIGSTGAPISASRIALAEKLRDCAKGVECAAKEARVRIDVEVEPGAEYLDADPALLRQMMLGLLSNAIKFNRPEGRVAVHAERTRSGLDISVADTGKGIPDSVRPHLFEPFGFGDSNVVNEDSRGLCLGLAIVKMLIERHGGAITIVSDESGTIATLSFPEERVPATDSVEKAA